MVAAVVAGTIGTVWLVLSALNQLSGLSLARRLRRHDPFGLLPVWTFFAPRPSTTDVHLLYRDRDREGNVSVWKEALPFEPSSMVRALWNPRKRLRKAVMDAAGGASRALLNGAETTAVIGALDTSYLALLLFVSDLDGTTAARQRQFAIARKPGAQGPATVLVLSRFHDLDGDVA